MEKTTEMFSVGDTEVTLFRLRGNVGGEPQLPVSREVVAVMAPQIEGVDAWTVAFWVADLDTTIAQVAQLQGSSVSPATNAPAGRSAIIADPAGATFSITQAPPSPTDSQ